MFAAVYQKDCVAHGRSDIVVESAGLDPKAAGQPAAAEWGKLQELTGIDLSEHRSRCIDVLSWRQLNQFDTVFCLDKQVHDELVGKRGWSAARVKLLDIPNPWGKGEQAYRDCYSKITELAQTI